MWILLTLYYIFYYGNFYYTSWRFGWRWWKAWWWWWFSDVLEEDEFEFYLENFGSLRTLDQELGFNFVETSIFELFETLPEDPIVRSSYVILESYVSVYFYVTRKGLRIEEPIIVIDDSIRSKSYRYVWGDAQIDFTPELKEAYRTSKWVRRMRLVQYH